eukprot:gene32903-26923_t
MAVVRTTVEVSERMASLLSRYLVDEAAEMLSSEAGGRMPPAMRE